jgi:hypothetical protein
MVAVQKRDSNPTLAAVMTPPVKDVDRRRTPVRQ